MSTQKSDSPSGLSFESLTAKSNRYSINTLRASQEARRGIRLECLYCGTTAANMVGPECDHGFGESGLHWFVEVIG